MEDVIFGTMSFRFGWIKNEFIHLWGKSYNVRIRTSSKKEELPTKIQQKSYLDFHKNFEEKCNSVKSRIVNYVSDYENEIIETLGRQSLCSPLSLLTPKEVLFFQNGNYALIFETQWSEAGMAILCSKDKIKIGESSILEFEY